LWNASAKPRRFLCEQILLDHLVRTTSVEEANPMLSNPISAISGSMLIMAQEKPSSDSHQDG